MKKTKVVKIYKSGPMIKGKIISYDIPIFFKYNLKTKKATWHGDDPEEGFLDAFMLSDKFGIDYKEIGDYIVEKCREYVEKNGFR